MPMANNGSVQLFYESFGDPGQPALLLVNGLGSQCINYHEEWCGRFVDRGFFVTRFDNRDVGLSDKFDDAELPSFGEVMEAVREKRTPVPDVPYRLPDMANDAVAVLDAIGVEKAHVVGASMGGMIVQQMAIDHPERLLSVTSVMSTTGERDVGQATPEAMEHLMGAPATDREGAIERHLKGLSIFGSPGQIDEEYHRRQAGLAYDRCFNPRGVARQMMAITSSGPRADALCSVTVPTLVLHGDQDKLVDISGGRRTAEVIPGARFVALEGMGHDYPKSYWDRWIDLIAAHAGLPAAA